ncbi:uncharacterized protein UV8b_07248 [Ustilaginoidea virens]|uniref:Uncharacterized protein n=1 Tax=Ustilaginoidea virens TaxID=1159556 RepID=A0A063BS04_USTVR|nr:uncharacterized protein UV8b_07248 [Ustilaginoidea virens]QUC23007.1 hypothetical protein UV8b_07248 [Ustilaginoidea virens]GAO19084.1 hypothetical protein UVI_02042160 [Ustilaginoidea virens]
MSRALDPSVKEALGNGRHADVFEQVATVFSTTQQQHGYLEIEILPRSHAVDESAHFLQDGRFVAIPRLRLAQAFLHARRILASSLSQSGEPVAGDDDELQSSTAVILLMDPEHLTAANTRKRLLLRKRQSQAAGSAGYRERLARESFVLNSLLTSRLHRHTKSPVLWNHKRWLLRQMEQAELPVDTAHEFERVICVAAERHARNYHAWSYARDVMALRTSREGRGTGQPDTGAGEIVALVARWCRLHHDDISGWSFLLHLALLFPSRAAGVFDDVVSLTEKYRWRNESVWHFVRNAALVPGVHQVQVQPTDEARVTRVWKMLRREVAEEGDLEARMLEAKILDRAAGYIGVDPDSWRA